VAGENIKVKKAHAVTVDAADIEKVLGTGDGDAARVFLAALLSDGGIDAESAAEKLDIRVERASRAIALLQSEMPSYQEKATPGGDDDLDAPSISDIAKARGGDGTFRALCDALEGALSRTMRKNELFGLFEIYRRGGLPPEVLMLIIKYQSIRRGRDISIREIEKQAALFRSSGVETYDDAEKLVASQEKVRKSTFDIMRRLRIDGRMPSSTEEKYIKEFIDMGFSADAVEMAYDRTVINVGALKWGYMRKILINWHEKGLHTPDEISKGDGGGRSASREKADNRMKVSEKFGESELREIEKSKEYIRRKRGEG